MKRDSTWDTKSAVVEHSTLSKNYIYLEYYRVITSKDRHKKRHIHEDIEIEKHPKTFNRDDSLILRNSWKPIYKTLRMKKPNNYVDRLSFFFQMINIYWKFYPNLSPRYSPEDGLNFIV